MTIGRPCAELRAGRARCVALSLPNEALHSMTIFAGIAVMPWITTRDTVMERDELLKHLEMIKSNRRDDGQLTPPLQRGPLQPEQDEDAPDKGPILPRGEAGY